MRSVAAFGVLAASPARADALSVSDILSQFNAVIFGDFSSTADVEGRTVVGGNLSGGATFDLNPANAAASSFSGLTVYGNATGGGNYNVDNGGGVTIAGGNSVSFAVNGGGAAFIGGVNNGSISGGDAITVGSDNHGTLSINHGASVFIGGNNSGQINASGGATLAINGSNSANLNMNGSGYITLNGSNTGTIGMSGGTFTYTGQQLGNTNFNGVTTKQATSVNLQAPASTLPAFGSTFQAPLTTLSAQLDAIAANSVATSSNNAITFNAKPNAAGMAVFDINASFLTPNSTLTINLDGATLVVINVSVDNCVSTTCVFSLPNSLNFANPAGFADNVLWNFVNATGLTVSNEIGGSVLAPFAAVVNNAPIDGTLVADSYSGDGELHSHPFAGTLPDSASTSVDVPEPAGLVLVGPGLAGLAALRRRGRFSAPAA